MVLVFGVGCFFDGGCDFNPPPVDALGGGRKGDAGLQPVGAFQPVDVAEEAGRPPLGEGDDVGGDSLLAHGFELVAARNLLLG